MKGDRDWCSFLGRPRVDNKELERVKINNSGLTNEVVAMTIHGEVTTLCAQHDRWGNEINERKRKWPVEIGITKIVSYLWARVPSQETLLAWWDQNCKQLRQWTDGLYCGWGQFTWWSTQSVNTKLEFGKPHSVILKCSGLWTNPMGSPLWQKGGVSWLPLEHFWQRDLAISPFLQDVTHAHTLNSHRVRNIAWYQKFILPLIILYQIT